MLDLHSRLMNKLTKEIISDCVHFRYSKIEEHDEQNWKYYTQWYHKSKMDRETTESAEVLPRRFCSGGYAAEHMTKTDVCLDRLC